MMKSGLDSFFILKFSKPLQRQLPGQLSLYGQIFLYLCTYFHLSNKREVTLTDFEKKILPSRIFQSSMFIDFLDFFHPPLLVYCSYVLIFFQKIPPFTFIPTSSTIREMRVLKMVSFHFKRYEKKSFETLLF